MIERLFIDCQSAHSIKLPILLHQRCRALRSATAPVEEFGVVVLLRRVVLVGLRGSADRPLRARLRLLPARLALLPMRIASAATRRRPLRSGWCGAPPASTGAE